MKRAILAVLLVLVAAGCGSSSTQQPPQIVAQQAGALLASFGSASAPTVNEVLTTTTGTWTNSPTSYAYQWQDCNGSTCTSIGGATTSSYTIQPSDIGFTIDVVVTASNPAGSASQTSAQTGVVTSGAGLTCNLNATTSNYASQISSATTGQVVCLASGDYSGFTGTSKSAPGITITAAPGAAVTFNTGFSLALASVQNFTLDGTGGGGTMTVSGTVSISTGSLLNSARNLTFQNITFGFGSSIQVNNAENSNITFNRDVMINQNAPYGGGGFGAYVALFYETPSNAPTGVTIENSVLVSPGNLENPDRGIETLSPMNIENDVIAGFMDKSTSDSDPNGNHIDGIQLYSGTNGTQGGVVLTGNLCEDDYNCLAAWDGTSNNTITDNVCLNVQRGCFDMYADTGSVMNHNTTAVLSGYDPEGCGWEPNVSSGRCNNGSGVEISSKSGDRTPSGEVYTNNVSSSAPQLGGYTPATYTNNMWPSGSSPNIAGTASYAGGSNPQTWPGFELTPGSAGHAAGSDGLDVGIRSSNGGPPTGGGSTPTSTVAPAVTGTATHGNVLTSTQGTWTVTGNVPTAYTYQWFDCPSATFSTASCSTILTTAVASFNSPTYTLQASDEGDYVFSYVTVTNANGTANAASNGVGPVN